MDFTLLCHTYSLNPCPAIAAVVINFVRNKSILNSLGKHGKQRTTLILMTGFELEEIHNEHSVCNMKGSSNDGKSMISPLLLI